jgi:hypothetical protein
MALQCGHEVVEKFSAVHWMGPGLGVEQALRAPIVPKVKVSGERWPPLIGDTEYRA